jgi:Peptidase family M49
MARSEGEGQMRRYPDVIPGLLIALALIMGCTKETDSTDTTTRTDSLATVDIATRLDRYATVRLTADLTRLSATDRELVRLLIEAVEPMDSVFWKEALGEGAKRDLRESIDDPTLWRYVEVNYGPWDRLAGNEPFVRDVSPKPAGAAFYPPDMTDEEFETAAARDPTLRSLYTLVRRGADGLVAVPYHEAFATEHLASARKLEEAASRAGDPGLRRYLELRADALRTDRYQASDLAWLDMKDNAVDVVIGPIETYEDARFGIKAAHEGFVLVKDQDWSQRLQRFASLLPELQRGLPVPDEFKRETPGTDSDLNAYDVVYVSGNANAGAKTIAINLPNDEEVQLQKGTRRLQLENAMRAKFDKIMVPIADALVVDDQHGHVGFDAFFQNTMFHEVAHGLGIKNTINGRGTVRAALKDHTSALEEEKADVVGLYMVKQLYDRGELTGGSIEDNYTTFMAGLFRSVRFGAADAHGKGNMITFNFFRERGAFAKDEASGKYRVDYAKMGEAVDALAGVILKLQGDGDYDGVSRLMAEKGVVPADLQAELEKLDGLGIPRDIVFVQGPSVLFGS